MNVKNNKKDMEHYKNRFFTKEGERILNNFLRSLVKIYLNEEVVYPYKLPPILGIPMFKYAMSFDSRDDLYSRIKQISQLLGIDTINFNIDNKAIVLNL
ncbi:MAG: hypothetical protein R3321_14490 [Nitrososphaeraceae archaeon]|nr:hypothetical protein [Nitrososphaeraceae archaeon]